MLAGTVVIWSLVLVSALAAELRDPALHRPALRLGWTQLRSIALRVPLTLMAATYALAMLPQDQIVALLGQSSGATGILLAGMFGAALPGGPAISLPVVVVLREHGVGDAQTVALLTSWSVLALHRVLAFELPLLGGRFVLIRLASCAFLPLIAGFASGIWWSLARY